MNMYGVKQLETLILLDWRRPNWYRPSTAIEPLSKRIQVVIILWFARLFNEGFEWNTPGGNHGYAKGTAYKGWGAALATDNSLNWEIVGQWVHWVFKWRHRRMLPLLIPYEWHETPVFPTNNDIATFGALTVVCVNGQPIQHNIPAPISVVTAEREYGGFATRFHKTGWWLTQTTTTTYIGDDRMQVQVQYNTGVKMGLPLIKPLGLAGC